MGSIADSLQTVIGNFNILYQKAVVADQELEDSTASDAYKAEIKTRLKTKISELMQMLQGLSDQIV